MVKLIMEGIIFFPYTDRSPRQAKEGSHSAAEAGAQTRGDDVTGASGRPKTCERKSRGRRSTQHEMARDREVRVAVLNWAGVPGRT